MFGRIQVYLRKILEGTGKSKKKFKKVSTKERDAFFDVWKKSKFLESLSFKKKQAMKDVMKIAF